MRVFCPEHKRGFFAPRQSPVKCENRGHLLGELDFEGDAERPAEIGWQYCCNCEHFCPVDFDGYGLERCPVCARRSSLLYLCDRCNVISFESNTPLQTKNFTLTSEGVPDPWCPGCLRSASTDLYEHSCDELGVSLVTALDTCPACQERLDIAPTFPSTVAPYLKRTKSANKVNVTFDYETESFVPVEDGEFVVVTIANAPAIVLPRTPRFSARRDFYEFYQDYYHCRKPDAGEVQIIQPALVARAANGWRLETPGMLEVLPDQPKKNVVTAPGREPVAPAAPPEPAPAATETKEKSGVKACTGCGALVEAKYAFCWKCGSSMNSEYKRLQGNDRTRGMEFSRASAMDDDELTVQHEMRPDDSSLFSWTTPEHSERPPHSTRGSVLKLLAIGGVALLLASLGLFGVFRSESEVASATAAPSVAESVQPVATAEPASVPDVVPEQPKAEQPTTTPEEELRKLRQSRLSATESERRRVFQAMVKIEKQYPRDYRFPYERAKLAAKGSRSSARKEAFKALSVAAEKAINTGKANEMLNGLENDKSGDFQSLARGREEWTRLVGALKRRDASLLETP